MQWKFSLSHFFHCETKIKPEKVCFMNTKIEFSLRSKNFHSTNDIFRLVPLNWIHSLDRTHRRRIKINYQMTATWKRVNFLQWKKCHQFTYWNIQLDHQYCIKKNRNKMVALFPLKMFFCSVINDSKKCRKKRTQIRISAFIVLTKFVGCIVYKFNEMCEIGYDLRSKV